MYKQPTVVLHLLLVESCNLSNFTCLYNVKFCCSTLHNFLSQVAFDILRPKEPTWRIESSSSLSSGIQKSWGLRGREFFRKFTERDPMEILNSPVCSYLAVGPKSNTACPWTCWRSTDSFKVRVQEESLACCLKMVSLFDGVPMCPALLCPSYAAHMMIV